MAIRIEDEYINAVAASGNYPGGSFKNETSPGALDGTPLEKAWANDLLGMRDAILAAAGQGYSGAPDTATTSDAFNALLTLFLKNADAVSAATANKAVRRDANGRAKVADGVASDDIATFGQVSGKAYKGPGSTLTNGYFVVNTDAADFIVQFGKSPAASPDSNHTLSFAVPFPNAALVPILGIINATTNHDEVFPRVVSMTNNSITLRAERTANGTVNGTRYLTYLVIGY